MLVEVRGSGLELIEVCRLDVEGKRANSVQEPALVLSPDCRSSSCKVGTVPVTCPDRVEVRAQVRQTEMLGCINQIKSEKMSIEQCAVYIKRHPRTTCRPLEGSQIRTSSNLYTSKIVSPLETELILGQCKVSSTKVRETGKMRTCSKKR